MIYIKSSHVKIVKQSREYHHAPPPLPFSEPLQLR